MIKILYVVSTLKRTGPIVVVANIVKYLDRNKFIPIVITLSPEPKDSMKEYFEKELHTKVETLGLSRIKGLFFAKSHIKKFIKENNINILHSHGFRADGLVSKLSDVISVSTLHNYPYYDYPMKFGKLKGAMMARGHLKAIKKKPDSNIACAKTIAQEFKQNGLNLKYIQNGVDTEKYFPLEEEKKKELRKILGIDNDKKIFISVGSLIARKDMTTVIEGFKKYNDENSLLLIAGDGVEKESLKQQANENIKILGNMSNVVEYLQASDYFLSASLAEGLPNTVLEAMACGLPTVLSDIPSHLELYEGEEGNFFNVKDAIGLCELLKRVSKAFKMQQSISLKLVQENFSAKAMSEKYQKVYEEKLNGSI